MENKPHLPPIGMRIIKSSVAVFICYLVFYLRGEKGIVFYSQLAALWCIQPYVDSSLKHALQRTIGTFIGTAFAACVIPMVYYLLTGTNHLLQYAIISLMIVPIIYLTVLMDRKDASFFSCVVFLSIVVLHIEDGNPFLFVWTRFSDTMLGILIGMGVNFVHLPHKKRRDILFISGLDDTLINSREKLSNYSVIELNQMIDNGLKFTIATKRTPASLIEPMKQIHLNLPVIAMDGAVLYDINTRKYLKSYVMSHEITDKLTRFIENHGFNCYVNSIVDDTLIIYHKELSNYAEKDIFNKMYSSPHRNYIYGELPERANCIYIMMIDETEKIDNFYKEMKRTGIIDNLKVLRYTSDYYPGYSYIKIYNKNAKKENMEQYLTAELNCLRTVTFGSIAGKYDYTIKPGEPDKEVHIIRKWFEPIGFKRRVA